MMGKRWATKSLDTCLDKVYLDIILSVQMVKAMLLLNGRSLYANLLFHFKILEFEGASSFLNII